MPETKKDKSFIEPVLNFIKSIFQIILQGLKTFFSKIPESFSNIKWDSVLNLTAMFIFSLAVIACEVVFLHMLFITTSYLKATFIIAIAMLGIAAGSFIGFYLIKFNNFFVMLFSSILFLVSIVLSYYNIITIGFLKYPFFLILPFIFGSIIISTIFSKEHSNTSYFVNLIGSALGSVIPIFLVRQWKSEGALILIMVVPLIFLDRKSVV